MRVRVKRTTIPLKNKIYIHARGKEGDGWIDECGMYVWTDGRTDVKLEGSFFWFFGFLDGISGKPR